MITSMNFQSKSGKQISILDLIVNRQFTTLIKSKTNYHNYIFTGNVCALRNVTNFMGQGHLTQAFLTSSAGMVKYFLLIYFHRLCHPIHVWMFKYYYLGP